MTTASLSSKPRKMPFKARMKKAFGRTSSSSSSTEGTTTPNGHPIQYYKPHEVPKSKYRGAWNQEHQDKLQSFQFSFGRKTSMQGSEYSPAQTRANSRRSSWISTRRPSTKGSGRAGKEKQGSRAPSRVGQVPEIDGDDDVVNVGGSRAISRAQTKEKRGASFGKDRGEDENENELEQQQTVTLPEVSNGDRPFTEEELSKALSAATLKPPRSSGQS